MSRFNVSTNHPLIPNSQEYMYEQQFISINSEDRDVVKYPNSSDFIIELPQDYCNVQGLKLSSWSFPSNLDVFSTLQNNITMTFRINNPYNPGLFMNPDPLLNIMFVALYAHINTDFTIVIESGVYTNSQMATELTNRFNDVVTTYISDYISANAPSLLSTFTATGYDQFVILFNAVGLKLWFGNKSSGFILTNDSSIYTTSNICANSRTLPSYTNWGLPAFLGFTRVPAVSQESVNNVYPRFFYGDAIFPGDGGFWLIPDPAYLGASVYYLEAPFKTNLTGPLFFFMEIAGLNHIDETIPYSLNEFTAHTNETNGVVKSSFAKILISDFLQRSTWINDINTLKIYNPPAERIRKLKIKMRYHNGDLVDFSNNTYSFSLEFNIFKPQNKKTTKMYTPESITNSFN